MSSSHNLDTDGSRFKTMRGSDHSENHIRQRFEQKSSTLNYGEFYPGRSSSVDIHDGPKRGNPVYDNKDTQQRVKRGVGMMKVGSVPGQNRGSRGVMIHREQKEIRPQNYNDIQVKAVPAERFEYKPSSLTSKGEASHGFLDKGPPRRMGKVFILAFVCKYVDLFTFLFLIPQYMIYRRLNYLDKEFQEMMILIQFT